MLRDEGVYILEGRGGGETMMLGPVGSGWYAERESVRCLGVEAL